MSNPVLILTIIEVVLKYGPQAVIKLAELFITVENPTQDDIRKLFIDKEPEEYFEKQD